MNELDQSGGSGVGPMTPSRYRVVERREETPDTVTITLEPIDTAIASPEPGQFTMLWAFGIGEAPISVAGLDGGRLLHTIRAVGPVTEALCAAAPGATIGVRGPYGTGWHRPHDRSRDALVVAGGLGLAPVRMLIEALRVDPGSCRRLTVLLGARTPGDLLYADDLARWNRGDGIHLGTTVDVADPEWRGSVGLVTQLLAAAPFEPGSTDAYLCGPEVMMRFAARDIVELGCPSSSIQVSLERNMHCAIGHCGHCQLGPTFLCKDGPVLDLTTAGPLLAVPSL